MSPEIKDDSDCFLTVSFHIRLMRLCEQRKAVIDQGFNIVPLLFKASGGGWSSYVGLEPLHLYIGFK